MAETNGLLNRHTGITGIEGSNPSVSANSRPIWTDPIRYRRSSDISRISDGRIHSIVLAHIRVDR